MRWLLLPALVGLASGCDALLRLDHQPPLPDAGEQGPTDAPPLRCPPDYSVVEGSSQYRLASLTSPFAMAAADCADDEMAEPITQHTHLAVLSDTNELSLLYTMGNSRWVGLTDLAAVGTWRWVTAEPALDPSASNTVLWSTGEPNNVTVELCAHLDSLHTDHINNVVCSELHPYVCECDAYANDPTSYP